MAEKYFTEHPEVFWNNPGREECENDRVFLGVFMSVIKRRGGQAGIHKVMEIIRFLERENGMGEAEVSDAQGISTIIQWAQDSAASLSYKDNRLV